MESLAALGLAGNVVQFLDLATKVTRGTHEIFKSAHGLTIQHERFKALTEDLQEICSELRKPILGDQWTSQADRRLQSLAEECAAECKRLQSLLNELRVKQGGKPWESLLAAVKAIGKEEAISKIQKNLDSFRDIIHLELNKILNDKQSSVQRTLREMKKHNAQMNAQSTSQIAEITRKLDQISGFGVSEEHFAQLHSDLLHILSTGRSVATDLKVLQSLSFPQMKTRHERIHESHRNTFSWIFCPGGFKHLKVPGEGSGAKGQIRQRPKVHFLEWLRSSASAQSIFWLSGKAGSGKSTLMKYICGHAKTQTELRAWSGADPPVIASFFFWRSGSEIQKSQEGLLRSLLFEVLRKCPSIISKVIETKWTYAVRGPWSRPKEREPWTQSEMMQVFNILEDEHIEARFCFFIDGMDEYHGDPSDLIEVIRKLARSPNFKFCVSSRPWTEFREAFDVKERVLHLHELTHNDIRIFVHDKLEQHDRFIREGPKDSAYQELVMEIVERAQGVFLWVSLVVKSLLKGLTHADSVQILQQRLRRIPTDLEELFSHMLGSVDPIYESQMGRTFIIAMAASEPLPLIFYHTLDELQIDPNAALREEAPSLQKWENRDKMSDIATILKLERQNDMLSRLDARSRGLLEVSTEFSQGTLFPTQRVEFLHRTVRDYLEKPEIKKDLMSRANKAEPSGSEFIPEVALCHCLLAGIKTLPPDGPGSRSAKEVLEYIDDLLWYAYKAENSTMKTQKDLLDELDKALSIMFPLEDSRDRSQKPQDSTQVLHPDLLEIYNSNSLIELCAQRGLSKYLSLVAYTESFAGQHRLPLLYHALLPVKSPKHGIVNTDETVAVLLQNRADPNSAVVPSGTIWSAFLSTHIVDRERTYTALPKVELVEALLQAGADPNVKVEEYPFFGRLINGGITDALWDQRLHLLQSFVRYGASPNTVCGNGTIWQQRLEALYKTRNTTSSSQYFEEVKLLLQAKADMKIWVWKDRTWYTDSKNLEASREIHQTAQEAIEAIFDPQEAAELLQIVHETKGNGLFARLKRSLHRVFNHTAEF